MRGVAEATLPDEQRLAQHARSWVAQPVGRTAVVLHLSRMTAPAPRPHHRRIARALMDDEATRHDGHLFSLGNGDLVLLWNAKPGAHGHAATANARALPDILGRLLRADVPDPTAVLSVWPLETSPAALLTYARARLADRPDAAGAVATREPGAETRAAGAVADTLAGIELADLLRRQTAVRVDATEGLVPLFREITVSIAAVEAGMEAGPDAGGHGGADPFLVRHLAGQFDDRVLAALTAAVGRGGPLDPAAVGTPPIHLNLTLAAATGPAFAEFAAALVDAGRTAGIELSFLEACADPEKFAVAREVLTRHGLTLVLDGVSLAALRLTRAWLLRPDLLKLEWTPRLAELADPDRRALDLMLHEIGVERIVLQRAETEASLRWGLARGIRRFQGRHVDAMLSATRLRGCAHAAGCTLGQCIARAEATSAAGRRGCANLTRLDHATEPVEVVA